MTWDKVCAEQNVKCQILHRIYQAYVLLRVNLYGSIL
jgi:hypothetical protein